MPVKSHPSFKLTTPSDLEIVITRVFDAPRELVFDCWTQPEHVRRWWGCRGAEMETCDVDLRPGGAYRYVLRMYDGTECGFRGVYSEIIRPERLIHSFIYDPFPQAPAEITVTFAEHDGVTTVTERTLHLSKEARDGHLHSGMDVGAAESMERLAEHLDTLTC